MKNDVLDVLMYIFEQFQDQEYVVIDEANTLASELTEVGFSDVEIDSALDWIDGLVDLREQAQESDVVTSPSFSNRIFSQQECQVLSQRSRGFLYHLEQQGVLDAISREIVIERTMALNMQEVDLEQVKWITMMVLFNLPGRESACAWFENTNDRIH
jgi:Smg protein